MRHRRRLLAFLALVFVCALAGATSGFAQNEASQGVFAVTLQAQLTKTWNHVTTREEGDCATETHVRGSRSVILRSARPTPTTVTFENGRARYSPGLVRFLSGSAAQTGAVTTVERGGAACRHSTRRSSCARPRRALANEVARFFRRGKDRLAFARTRDFTAGLSPACPPQAQAVRAEGVSLHLAGGEISERGLFNRRYPAQTGFGSIEETTDFEGDANGKVVVRVSWRLTFKRVG
jgi:hypothetical protein